MKRIVVATTLGVAAGLVCVSGGIAIGLKFTAIEFGWALLNRTLIGFTIGISRLRLHWALHGVLLGAIVGSLFSYSVVMEGGRALMAIGLWFGGMVFGLLIELFTTVVFKQACPEPQKAAAAAVR